VRLCQLDVVGGIVPHADALFLGEFAAYLPGNAGHEGTRRDDSALEHDGAGRHEAARTDHRAVQDGRAHPDQAIVLDDAAVHDGTVPDADARADHELEPGVRVHRNVVLHIGARADRDRVGVTAEHTAVEDARIGGERDPPDQRRVRGDESRRIHRRSVPIERNDHLLIIQECAG
jgi:hypothetical protein